jgi:hypothetical protein
MMLFAQGSLLSDLAAIIGALTSLIAGMLAIGKYFDERRKGLAAEAGKEVAEEREKEAELGKQELEDALNQLQASMDKHPLQLLRVKPLGTLDDRFRVGRYHARPLSGKGSALYCTHATPLVIGERAGEMGHAHLHGEDGRMTLLAALLWIAAGTAAEEAPRLELEAAKLGVPFDHYTASASGPAEVLTGGRCGLDRLC